MLVPGGGVMVECHLVKHFKLPLFGSCLEPMFDISARFESWVVANRFRRTESY